MSAPKVATAPKAKAPYRDSVSDRLAGVRERLVALSDLGYRGLRELDEGKCTDPDEDGIAAGFQLITQDAIERLTAIMDELDAATAKVSAAK